MWLKLKTISRSNFIYASRNIFKSDPNVRNKKIEIISVVVKDINSS